MYTGEYPEGAAESGEGFPDGEDLLPKGYAKYIPAERCLSDLKSDLIISSVTIPSCTSLTGKVELISQLTPQGLFCKEYIKGRELLSSIHISVSSSDDTA